MTGEELERAIEFLVNQQAKFFSDMEAMKESINRMSEVADKVLDSHTRSIDRLERNERLLKLIIGTGQKLRKDDREIQSQMQDMRNKVDSLFDAQLHAEERRLQDREEFRLELKMLDERFSKRLQQMKEEFHAEMKARDERNEKEMAEFRFAMMEAIKGTNKRIDILENS